MLEKDLLVEDPDTSAVTKHSTNMYKYLSETLNENQADTYAKAIQSIAAAAAESRAINEFPAGKNLDEMFNKALREYNPVKRAFKNKAKVSKLKDINQLTYKNMLDAGFTDTQALDFINTVLANRAKVAEREAEEALKKPSFKRKVRTGKVQRYEGYTTISEQMSEARKEKYDAELKRDEIKHAKELMERAEELGANFFFESAENAYKASMSIIKDRFDTLIELSQNNRKDPKTTPLTREDVLKALAEDSKVLLVDKTDDSKFVISRQSLDQLEFLLEALDTWSRENKDSLFSNLTAFFTSVQNVLEEGIDNTKVISVTEGRTTNLWGTESSLKLTKEKFTIDSYKEELYGITENQITVAKEALDSVTSNQQALDIVRDVLDVAAMSKENPTKVRKAYEYSKFNERIKRIVNSNRSEVDHNYFKIINNYSHEGNLWDWINEGNAPAVTEDGIPAFNILSELQRNPFKEVRDFFTVPEGSSLPRADWQQRFDRAAIETQRLVAYALLNNKYILERLFALKDYSKTTTATEKAQLIHAEVTDAKKMDADAFKFGGASSNGILLARGLGATTGEAVSDISTVLELVSLADNNHLLKNSTVASTIALDWVFNLKNDHSFINNLVRSLYRYTGRDAEKDNEGKLQKLLNLTNELYQRYPDFQKNVDAAVENSFYNTTGIPDASWINEQTWPEVKKESSSDPLHALLKGGGKPLAVQEAMRNNWGSLVALAGLQKQNLINDKGELTFFKSDRRDTSNFTTIFNLLSYADASKAAYSDYVQLTADTMEPDTIPALFDAVLSWNDYSAHRAEILADIKSFLNDEISKGFTVTPDDSFKITEALNNEFSNGKVPDIPGLNENSARKLAYALATVINKYEIPNTTRNLTDVSVTFKGSQNLADEIHRANSLFRRKEQGSNNSLYFKERSKKAFTLYRNGLNRLLSQYPDLKTNNYISFYKRCSEAIKYSISRPMDEFGALEYTLDGELHEYVGDTCAAVALSMMPRFNTNPNEDFLTELAGQYGVAVATTFGDKNKHLFDAATTVLSIGEEVARILGYRKGTLLFERVAARFGSIAMISLWKGKMGVEPVWINKTTGDVIPADSTGEEKANCIPAFQLSQEGIDNQEAINNAITLTDQTDKTNLADKLLDTEIHGDETTHTNHSELKKLSSFIREYDDTYGTNLSSITALAGNPNKVNLDELVGQNAIGKQKVADVKNDKNEVIGKVIKVGDYALVMFNKNDEGIPQPITAATKQLDYVVMRGKAVIKTDFTGVTPRRLLTLAMQADRGVELHVPTAINALKPLLKWNDQNKEWESKFNLNDAKINETRLEELCRTPDGQLTTLGVIIYQNSRYGSDPRARSGLDSDNVFRANIEDFKTLIKDVQALLPILNDKTRTSEYQKLYFSEINTVNNRLLVDSKRFNYREFKHWRLLTTVSKAHEKYFDSSKFDNTQKAMFVAPILTNLGLDVDKMWTTADVIDCWTELIKNTAFQELLKSVRTTLDKSKTDKNLDVYTEILQHVTKYNNSKNLPKYRTYKAKASEYTNQEESKIKVSLNSAVTLAKLNDIQVGRSDSFTINGRKTSISLLDYLIPDPNDTFKYSADGKGRGNIVDFWGKLGTVSNYDITFEVDGLTNGPSFKSIGSGLSANQDAFSALYLGATGTSSEFTNIVEGYMNQGIQDTYLSAKKLSKEDLIYSILQDYAHSNWDTRIKPMAYLNTLYGKGAGTAPDFFMQRFAEALDSVLSRDFMKPITMVIGYEAGKASVILTALRSLDEQFSKQVGATGDLATFKRWYEGIANFMGNTGSVTMDYIVDGQVYRATLNIANNTITLKDRTVSIDNLTATEIKHLSITHATNPALLESMSNIFGQMYDAIARNKEIVQGPFEALTEATKSVCDAFDVCMQKAIEKVFESQSAKDADGRAYISATNVIDALEKISKILKDNFSTILHLGVEDNYEDRALLDFSKEDRDTLVGKAFNQYTVTKDGKYYLNIKSGFAARVSRGAGVVPMDIHSYDSSVMHVMLESVMNAFGDRILSIHDAEILSLFQGISEAPEVTPNDQGKDTVDTTLNNQADGIREANKAHYKSQFRQIRTLIDMLQNIDKAMNSVTFKQLGLSDDEAIRLKNSLERSYNNLFNEVLSLINLKKKFVKRELDKKNPNERLHDFQYCFMADDDGTAIGAYRPTDSDLESYDKELDSYIRLLKVPRMHKYQEALAQTIGVFAQRRNHTKAILNSDGRVSADIWMQATTLDSLISAVMSRLNLKGTELQRAQNELTSAINEALRKARSEDPAERHKDAIVNLYRTARNISNTGNIHKVRMGQPYALYDMAHASVDNFLFHTNDEVEFGRIFTRTVSSKLGDPNDKLSQFDALRRMTGLNLQANAFDNKLIQLFYNHYNLANVPFEYSTSIPSNGENVVLYTDGVDSEKLFKEFQKHSLEKDESKLYDNLAFNISFEQWAANYLENLNQFDGKRVNVIITLRSAGDVLHAMAIQALKNTGHLTDVNLVLIPAISNLNNQSTDVDREVGILQVLKEHTPNLGAMYITGTHSSHNVELQSYIMGKNLNWASAKYGMKLQSNKISLLRKITSTVKDPRDSNKNREISYYRGSRSVELNTQEFASPFSRIMRKDELGRTLQIARYQDDTSVYQTDLYTHGVSEEVRYQYNSQILAEDYQTNAGYSITHEVFTPANSFNYEQILGNDSTNATVVHTDAEGNILYSSLDKIAKKTPQFTEALNIGKKLRKEKLAEFYKTDKSQGAWNEALLPVVVPVSDSQFSQKYYIFTVAIDNSITAKDLNASLQRRGSGTVETMLKARINTGSKLDIMLKNSVKGNAGYLRSLEHMLNSYEEDTESDSRRIFIDLNKISNIHKNAAGALSTNLIQRNAECLNTIASELRDRGVKSFSVPIQSARWYHLPDRSLAVGRSMASNTQVVVLGDLSSEMVESVTAAYQQQRGIEERSLASEAAYQPVTLGKNTGNGPVKYYSGYAMPDTEEEETDAGFLTTHTPNGTMMRFRDAGIIFTDLMNEFIADDEARGVDTSLVRENMPILSNLVSLARITRVHSGRGIRASRTFTENIGNPLEREAVIIGEAVGTQSQSEAFMHEMLHTIWKHISLNDPALRKKLTDMYNFVQRNLQFTDFTEGRTFANEAIHDSVFNTATLDNVEEFLCYYLTNRAFHDAVSNMAARRGSAIDRVLTSNTRGIFRRILSFIRSLFGYKETKVDISFDIPSLVQEAAEVAIKYNNTYWLRKQDIIEEATQSTIEELTETDSGSTQTKIIKDVLDKMYEDSAFTKKVSEAVLGFSDAVAIGSSYEKSRAYNNAVGMEHENEDVSLLNLKKNWDEARDGFINNLLASLESVSHRQFNYLILRTRGKAQIDQRREQVKSAVNSYVKEILANVDEKCYEPLVRQFMRNDVSCLFDNTEQTPEQVYNLLTDNRARENRIAYLEQEVQAYEDPYYLLNCARGLAHYLTTGFNPTGIGYRNVYEIMARSGSSNPRPVDTSSQQYHNLDQLVTLYALRESPDLSVFDAIPANTLYQLSRLHNGIKRADNADVYAGSTTAQYHVPKGEIHQSTGDTHRYDIVNEKELAAYEWTGYKKVKDAVLDPYFRAQYPDEQFVMVRAPYKSEAVTTAGIFSMTNIFKGRSTGGLKMGNFTRREFDTPFRNTQESRDLENYINRRIRDLNSANPHLLAEQTSGNLQLNFNFMNGVSGATFEINPIDAIKQKNSHLSITSALGDLFGSILERTETPRVNEMAVRSIMDIYENSDQKEAFRWISPTSENEEYRELYEHLPYEVQQLVQERFGNRGLPVHIRSLNTVFGYRNMSANDTKTFIESERRKQNNADQLIHDFSVSASNILYNGYLGNTEAFMKWLAKVGKENIVIKGLTTSIYNILSNCTLLSINGLSAKQIITYQLEALKQFDVLRQYNYQLAVLRRRRLMGEYTDADARQEASINRSREALPIYPLYHEGILGNTIAEDLTESEGITKNLINKFMPRGKLRTIVHNLALDNESMLYRILADIASLGDVTGKYALYKHNISKHMSERDALKESLSTFTDYSNPLPRELQLADDFAILPFMKYTLGIQSVIAKTLVKHPDRSLGWLLGANMLTNTPNVWESLLWFDTIWDKVGLPGSMFADSIKCLPPAKFASIID